MKHFTGYKFLGILVLLKAICVFLTGCGLRESENQSSKNQVEDLAGGRTVLTVATDWVGTDLAARVKDFNESNQQYYVELRQYDRSELSEDPIEDFTTQLVMDILSGKGPDLVNMDASNYSPAIASEKLTLCTACRLYH